MNKTARAHKYNEALREFNELNGFYIQRITNAREVVLSVWRKQYQQKLDFDQLKGTRDLSLLFRNDLKIRSVNSTSSGRTRIEISHRETRGGTVNIDSVFIHGSDRDIAKIARRAMNDEYRRLLWEEMKDMKTQMNPNSILWLQRDIEEKQKKLAVLQEEYDSLGKKYNGVRKARLMHGWYC